MTSVTFFLLVIFLLAYFHYHREVESRAYSTVPVTFEKHRDKEWAICEDCNFHGGDLNYYFHNIYSMDDCLNTCIWYGTECTHFVFTPNPRYCYLKGGRVHFHDAYPYHNMLAQGGIRCNFLKTPECRELIEYGNYKAKFFYGPPAKFLRSRGCFFPKSNVIAATYNTTDAVCASECRKHSWCSHYNFKEEFCDMFQGPIEATDALKADTVSYTACGIDCYTATETQICRRAGTYNWVVQNSPDAYISRKKRATFVLNTHNSTQSISIFESPVSIYGDSLGSFFFPQKKI